MPNSIKLAQFTWRLRKLIMKTLVWEKKPYQAMLPGFEPPDPPWYLTLLRICITTILQVVSGFALAIVLLIISHYLGFDGPDYPQP